MADVVLRNITKIFGRSVLGLDSFSLEVKDKEFLTVLGPSGSGKSTILRLIAGLERQDKGDVFIADRCVNELSPQERDVAFVFQNYALYPHMDVYENIAVGLRLKKYPRLKIEKRVREVVELLEISELVKRRPKALSGGQRQRVALARAIAKRPKVFLLDEPLSNLDAILREKMRVELKSLFKKIAGTVIYVTHDQTEAMSLSDKTVLIDKGKLKAAGSIDELYYQPKDIFVASFLGSPGINIFEAAVDGECFVFDSLRWKIPEKYLSRLGGRDKVILGVRPEDIEVYSEPRPEALAVRLIMFEKMGRYGILNLSWQGKILRSVVEKDFLCRFDSEELWVEFKPEKLYLFDRETKQLLC